MKNKIVVFLLVIFVLSYTGCSAFFEDNDSEDSSTPDTTAPVISTPDTTTPDISSSDTAAPVIQSLTISDVPMNIGDTVSATITVVSDTDTYTSIAGSIGGFAMTNLIKINDTTYTAQFSITDGGIDVAAGSDIPVNFTLNDGAGNTSNIFTSPISQGNDPIDANMPDLDSVNPAENAVGVGLADNLTLTFSETVNAGTGNFVIYHTSDNSVFETISLTGGSVTGWGGTTLTVNPMNNFVDNTNYYVQFPAGAVLDNNGNSALAITDNTTWNFSTPDSISPLIQSFSSSTANGNYTPGDTINITATASESIKAGSVLTVTLDTGDTILLTAAADGTTLTGIYTVGAGDTSSDLKVNSFVNNSVVDLAGNTMTAYVVPTGNNISDVCAITVGT